MARTGRSSVVLLRRDISNPADVVAESGAPGDVFACDFPVSGAETGRECRGGYVLTHGGRRIMNIDHHAPTPRMCRPICSTHLAIEALRAGESAGPDDTVVVNHADCDSVLSGAIVAGELEAAPEFAAAALAADHTGACVPVADLLLAVEHNRDLEMSLRNLRLLLQGRPVEAEAQSTLEARSRERETAATLASGARWIGAMAFMELPKSMDSALFRAFLPDAVVILLTMPRPGPKGLFDVKLRLGQAAPDGLTLFDLRVSGFDPNFDGRWNAGANKSKGGTTLGPARYAELLSDALRRCDASRRTRSDSHT